jgi:hypothetical protein
MKFFQPSRDVPPNALLLLRIIDVCDNSGLAKLLRKARNMVSPLPILFVTCTRMIEMQLLDILEGHIRKCRQIGVRDMNVLDA